MCRRVTLELVLEAVEPPCADVSGAGKRYPMVDLFVVYYSLAGRIVSAIPASGLRGVLRIASMLACSHCGLVVHGGVGEGDCIGLLEDQVSSIVGSKVVFDDYRRKASMDSLAVVLQGLCPICLLYGASLHIPSRVFVRDFPVAEEENSTVRFKGAIVLLNTPNWMLSLFAATLLAIHDGKVKVNVFKGRSMGRIRVLEKFNGFRINEDNLVIRLEGAGVGCGRLEPLDTDIDNVDDVPDCSCSSTDSVLVCRNNSAMTFLRRLAKHWYSVYCDRVRKAWEKRFQAAIREIVRCTSSG